MMGLPGPQAFRGDDRARGTERYRSTTWPSSPMISSSICCRANCKPSPAWSSCSSNSTRYDLPRCIATSSPHHFVRSVLEIIDMRERFDFVVTAEDVTHGKPAPDIYLEAARRMGIAATGHAGARRQPPRHRALA